MLDFDLSQFVESVTSIINAVFSCSCKHSSSCGPGTVTVTVCGCSVNRVQPTKTYQSRQLSQPLWHRPTGSDHAASRCLHRSSEDAALLPATCGHERSTLVWFTNVYWGFVFVITAGRRRADEQLIVFRTTAVERWAFTSQRCWVLF